MKRSSGKHSKVWVALNDLGNAYVAAGDVSNAIDTLREAVEAEGTQWWSVAWVVR